MVWRMDFEIVGNDTIFGGVYVVEPSERCDVAADAEVLRITPTCQDRGSKRKLSILHIPESSPLPLATIHKLRVPGWFERVTLCVRW